MEIEFVTTIMSEIPIETNLGGGLLAIIIPLVVTRGYARLNRRLKNIGNKLDKRKQ